MTYGLSSLPTQRPQLALMMEVSSSVVDHPLLAHSFL
jgi:hypothetical protein